MILVYKIKHNQDLTKELQAAMKIARFAIENRDKLSTKYVKHLGLRSEISNQILRKYGRNKKIRVVHSVPLIISGHHVLIKDSSLWIRSLNLLIPLHRDFVIKQIELNKEYLFIYHEVPEGKQIKAKRHIGVDLNTTGHCAVVAVKETGKVYKLGKKSEHIHKKYSHIRKNLQKKGKFKALARMKRRESNIVKDINHKISRFIVNLAVEEKGGIQLEKLQEIRKSKSAKSFKYALNSWSYYQLDKFIEYKSLLAGVPVAYINPAYTSKSCSRCGVIGERNNKYFKCPKGHVENADVNAAFNIAVLSNSILKLQADRDACKGLSVTPQGDRP